MPSIGPESEARPEENPNLSTGCPHCRALPPLFGFSSGRYPVSMEVQYPPRGSKHAPRFPNTIRECRLRAGLSQRKLGALLGRGRNAISSWERGLTKPDVTLGVRMAKTLATLVESLYQDFYSPPPEYGAQTDT